MILYITKCLKPQWTNDFLLYFILTEANQIILSQILWKFQEQLFITWYNDSKATQQPCKIDRKTEDLKYWTSLSRNWILEGVRPSWNWILLNLWRLMSLELSQNVSTSCDRNLLVRNGLHAKVCPSKPFLFRANRLKQYVYEKDML